MIFSFVDHVYRVNIRTPVLPDKMPMRASTDDARTESIPIPFSVHAHCLRTGLLLLLLPQSEQTDTGNLDDLESHTGNITLGLALTTETSQEHLVVLVHEVQATVVGDCCGHHVSAHHIRAIGSARVFEGSVARLNSKCRGDEEGVVRTESGDLLSVLDQLHTHTLSDGGVGLLGLDTDLLEDDSLGVG